MSSGRKSRGHSVECVVGETEGEDHVEMDVPVRPCMRTILLVMSGMNRERGRNRDECTRR